MSNNGGYRPGSGRKKGSKTPLTLKIERARQVLVDAYIEKIKPLNEALIAKGLAGDVSALKELHDRVYGRPAQPLVGSEGGAIKIESNTIKFI